MSPSKVEIYVANVLARLEFDYLYRALTNQQTLDLTSILDDYLRDLVQTSRFQRVIDINWQEFLGHFTSLDYHDIFEKEVKYRIRQEDIGLTIRGIIADRVEEILKVQVEDNIISLLYSWLDAPWESKNEQGELILDELYLYLHCKLYEDTLNPSSPYHEFSKDILTEFPQTTTLLIFLDFLKDKEEWVMFSSKVTQLLNKEKGTKNVAS